jgi:HEPN domain-containing protein
LLELVQEWLNKGNDDLRLAELIMDTPPPIFWAAAFHAQQACEKFLKAFLTFHSIEFEKVHDMEYLVNACQPKAPWVGVLRIPLVRLTDFAVNARYPLPRVIPTEAEVREAIETAHKARELVLGELPKDLGK